MAGASDESIDEIIHMIMGEYAEAAIDAMYSACGNNGQEAIVERNFPDVNYEFSQETADLEVGEEPDWDDYDNLLSDQCPQDPPGAVEGTTALREVGFQVIVEGNEAVQALKELRDGANVT